MRILIAIAALNLAATLATIVLIVQVGKRIGSAPPRAVRATTPTVAPAAPRYRIAAFTAAGAEQDAVYVGDDGRLAAQAWRSLEQGTRRGLFRFYDRARLRGTINRTGDSV